MIISPEFDPFYQDIKLKDRMDASDSNEQKNKIREQAIDYTKRKNISIVGVKKISNLEKKKFYNIENFDFSYSFNDNAIILSDIMIDGKYNQKVNERLNNIYFRDNDLQNKIYFKNMMNDAIAAYAG